MPAKILLADDSPTIQKVIRITLSGEPYDILDCASEKDLYKILKGHPIDLVLLDFNLSEDCSGYDLVKKLKEIRPGSKVVIMFGTFDTIDENALKMSGSSGKVVKPFDSSKFINLCHGLLDNISAGQVHFADSGPGQKMDVADKELPDEAPTPTAKDDDLMIKFDRSDDWVINSPASSASLTEAPEAISKADSTLSSFSMPIEKVDPGAEAELSFSAEVEPAVEVEALAPAGQQEDLLEMEVKEWGMNLPPKMEEMKAEGQMPELPPFLFGSEESTNKVEEAETPVQVALEVDENKMPSQDDLEYPSMAPTRELSLESTLSIELPKEIAEDSGPGLELNGIEIDQQVEETSEPIALTEMKVGPSKDIMSKFIPLTELKEEEPEKLDEGFDPEETDPSFNLSFSVTQKEGAGRNLEELIHDEVSPDKFWSIDKGHEKGPEEQSPLTAAATGPERKAPPVEQNVLNFSNESTSPSAVPRSGVPGVDMEVLVNEMIHKFADGILETMRPLIEENIKKYCQETIEKIAWEILPDLAENIVKKELSNIAEAVKKEKES